ncbi:MAG: hypothetical protein A2527_00345 [Candidatus Lambdaproteobacteria bacterium RIFOXYD2_FULL_50_16]|uniref:histidine kinase n=1 Tax=Candidatus Lambdaproteobacteria bacterium RIFOXYD2_FULL_50_16 TaxID=1817772 RepID=A0A1F6GFH0_9PROT|nr:MAG: hypothetical protein A2527_00345 [Candidatus Lambdaproteobacteria bacterium RIFOXYD2_FULL_50_16]
MTLEKQVQQLANNLMPIFLKIGVLVFSIEVAIMLFIPLFGELRSPLLEALVDASVLTLVVTPVTYFIFFKSQTVGPIFSALPNLQDIEVQGYLPRLFRMFLAPFLLVTLVVGVMMTGYYRTELSEQQSAIVEHEERLGQIKHDRAHHQLEMIFADLNYLQSHLAYGELTPDELYKILQKEFVNFTKVNKIYSSASFIDLNRVEQVRVFYDKTAQITPKAGLNPKISNPAVEVGLNLNKDHLYISPFLFQKDPEDLAAHWEMQLSKPIFDLKGNRLGVVLLDFPVDHLLANLQQIHAYGQSQLFISNADGQIFDQSRMGTAHNNQKASFKKRNQVKPSRVAIVDEPQVGQRYLSQYFPQAWRRIKNQGVQGEVFQTQEGWFVQHKIGVYKAYNHFAGSIAWEGQPDFGLILLSYIPQAQIDTLALQLRIKAGIVFFILTFCLGAVIFMALNIWLQREAQELEMIKAKDRAEEATRAKSEFLANMSHEIRTPMNAILGFAEILKGRIKDNQSKQYLESINASGKNLLALINDILDLSKVEAGKLTLEITPVSIAQVIQDVTQIFSQKIKEKGLELVIEMDPRVPPSLMLDETRLRQVLLNLVGNAIKFTAHGQIKVTVEVLVLTSELVNLRFLVQDTGIGLDPQFKSLVFGAFEQSPGQSNANFGGTGLGLAICRRLVSMMGGEIWVESDLGQGCQFYFTLPQVIIAEIDPDHTLEQIIANESTIQFAPARLLLVDDIALNRDLFRAYLEGQPFSFEEAGDGAEAVQMATNQPPDLILMDYKMPIMDGMEAVKELSKNPVTTKIPVICVTASVMRSTEQEIRKHFEGYLRKPLTKSELFFHLKRFLPYQEGANGVSKVEPSPTFIPIDQKLIAELEGPLMEKWEQVKDTQVINQVEEFAQEISNLCQKGRCPALENWAKVLGESAQMFNIVDLARILGRYPEMVADLRRWAQADL